MGYLRRTRKVVVEYHIGMFGLVLEVQLVNCCSFHQVPKVEITLSPFKIMPKADFTF